MHKDRVSTGQGQKEDSHQSNLSLVVADPKPVAIVNHNERMNLVGDMQEENNLSQDIQGTSSLPIKLFMTFAHI